MQVRKTESEIIPHAVVLIEAINSRIIGISGTYHTAWPRNE